MLLRAIAVILPLTLPLPLLAAGGGAPTPPTPTDTTKTCTKSQIWDAQKRACVDARESSFNDADRMDAVRELAYAGAYGRATAVLTTLDEAEADIALTYAGFIARKTGDLEGAEAYYNAALTQNPKNHLARSYRAQGWVAQDRLIEAYSELQVIRATGGAGTWAEASLVNVLKGEPDYSY